MVKVKYVYLLAVNRYKMVKISLTTHHEYIRKPDEILSVVKGVA